MKQAKKKRKVKLHDINQEKKKLLKKELENKIKAYKSQQTERIKVMKSVKQQEQFRKKVLADAELASSKSRFGLFSQPPPLALGASQPSLAKKNIHSESSPNLQHTPFYTNYRKKGILKSQYFQVPSSIYIGDPYVDASKLQLQRDAEKLKRSKKHQSEFRPASAYKTTVRAAYEHIDQNPPSLSKEIVLDEYGKVRTAPRNITSNPCTKIQRTLLKSPEHTEDPFELKQQALKQEKKLHKSKIIGEPFKSMGTAWDVFTKPSIILNDTQTAYKEQQNVNQNKGTEGQKLRPKTAKTSQTLMKTFKHEAAWRPNSAKGGCIGVYPKFMPNSPSQTTINRIDKEKDQNRKQNFRPASSMKSKPCPSISLNRTSLVTFVRSQRS